MSAPSTVYQDSPDPFDPEHVELSTARLIAKPPTIPSYAYKKSTGQPFLYPDNTLGYVENFLRMTFGVPAASHEVDPVVARVLDLLFTLHADTSRTVRPPRCGWSGPATPILSRRCPPGSACSSARCTVEDQAVLEMLQRIHADDTGGR